MALDGSAPSSSKEQTKRRLPMLPVAALLEQQRTLTAVDRFSRLHEDSSAPLQSQYYRDLIPLDQPKPGQQFAFQVDLDACTGCKACVSACHTLNGLDDNEMWRTVGLLHGGTPEAPDQQTVTTSCHHCVEPACLAGCPTQAYEKDPVTGIVKHLDDQCFGCQYCTLMCPYDAPKYSKSRGIVRKCDMCSDRLSHGEAPACVQACPNSAISIAIVERERVIEASDAQRFLPGAPTPEHTLPTTQYTTARAMPNNMLPADFYTTRPEHSHMPLVVMLTLTQLAVGAFGSACLAERLSPGFVGSTVVQASFACALALLALGAAMFHLGRPHLAWRAVLGLKTSWFSREVLAFGLFAKLGILYPILAARPPLPDFPGKDLLFGAAPAVQVAASIAGLLGVFCSVMVYVATRREQWSSTTTGIKFFGTTFALGASTVFAVSTFTGAAGAAAAHGPRPLLWLVIAATFIKLTAEARSLAYASARQNSTLKRMALVMRGELKQITLARFAGAALGGLILPLVLSTAAFDVITTQLLAAIAALVLLGAELLERYLFFRAAPASRMPGKLK
jgi:Fe-S-cluster-containing dehydrogenase component/DMSO reductase anchor subunit